MRERVIGRSGFGDGNHGGRRMWICVDSDSRGIWGWRSLSRGKLPERLGEGWIMTGHGAVGHLVGREGGACRNPAPLYPAEEGLSTGILVAEVRKVQCFDG